MLHITEPNHALYHVGMRLHEYHNYHATI